MRGPPGTDRPDGALRDPMLRAVATPTKRCSQGGDTGVSICFVKGVLQGLHLFETPPGAECDAVQGPIGDGNRQPRGVAQHLVQVP